MLRSNYSVLTGLGHRIRILEREGQLLRGELEATDDPKRQSEMERDLAILLNLRFLAEDAKAEIKKRRWWSRG